MTDTQAAVVVFARPPIAGEAKTRLIPALGAVGAAELYRRLLMRTLAVVDELGDVQKWLFWSRPTRDVCPEGWRQRIQREGDLGQRMWQAMEEVLVRSRSAVIIGSDCAILTASDLAEALACLEPGTMNGAPTEKAPVDVVLGPTEDGGYYLVGCPAPASRALCETLFANKPWSEDSLIHVTRSALRRGGYTLEETRMLWDVDDAEDLARLRRLAPEFA